MGSNEIVHKVPEVLSNVINEREEGVANLELVAMSEKYTACYIIDSIVIMMNHIIFLDFSR